MLRPIPIRILTTTAKLDAPTSADRNGKATYTSYSLTKTHIQPSSSTKHTKDNTEVCLRSLLFYDVANSRPSGLDFSAIKNKANELGVAAVVTIGAEVYTLATVDNIPDDQGKIHHWELGLV